jgi:hypothetical protein
VRADARAQRRVQEVRRGVVAGGRAPVRRVDARDDALALVQLALLRLEHERLVVAEPHDVDDTRAAAAVLALDHARVGDLAAAGRVERRLDELQQHATVLARDGADRRRLLDPLVARERRRDAGRLGERDNALAPLVAVAAARVTGAPALLVHQALEALRVDAQPLLGGQLERQVEREPVRVVQQERLLRADALAARVARAGDHVVEQPHALLKRAVEGLLLGAQPHLDRLALLVQLGIRGAHQLAHDAGEARQEAGLDADLPALHDRAPHQPAQHVAAVLVGRYDAVGDEERHTARVVGEDAQRAVGVLRLTVGPTRELLAQRDERADLVGLEDRRRALHDRREPVEPQAGVDVLRRQRRQDPLRLLVVLHEHEVPVLEEPLAVGARQLLGRPELEPAVEVELAARPARACRAGLPEVVLARERDDPLARHADREPRLDRLLVRAEAERVVALEDRHPDPLGIEAEALERELPGELHGALLEVVADREVAQHLEEREVPVGAADVVDVDRAKALLAGRQTVGRRLLGAEEVGLERVHARADQQRRRIVARHERRRGQALMPAVGEVGQEALADLV